MKDRADHPDAPIPGLAVLDDEGRYVGGVLLPAMAADEVVALLRQ